MCGLAGFSRAPKSSIPNGRTFAVHLAEAIESRGRHATGFGWFEGADLENVWYSKKKGPAKRVAKQLALPKQGITVLAAHTRHYTLGSPAVYENNHPVVANQIVATHNGRVDNHEELVELAGIERAAEVDSFAIPALLSQAGHLGAGHPSELLEMVRGVASMAWLDADEHNVLHLARLSTRPLHIGWTKRGDLVYSSTKRTLERASQAAKVTVKDIVEVKEGTYLRVENGAIMDWTEFPVVHPPVVVQEDMPGLSEMAHSVRGTQYTYPSSFDADSTEWWDDYDRQEAARKELTGDLWDALVDGETIDIDSEIDWGNIVPRRGHSDFMD